MNVFFALNKDTVLIASCYNILHCKSSVRTFHHDVSILDVTRLCEVNRGRGLERSLEELQEVHLEQNRELQRLQEEGR